MTDFLEHLGVTATDPHDTDRPGDDAGLGVLPGEQHANRNGTVHGGVIATLLDSVMGNAVRAGLDDDQSAATVSMTVTYLSPGAIGEQLRASAEVRKRGSSLVMVEADVVQGNDDEPVAHGVATYSVISKD